MSDLHRLIAENTARTATQITNPNSAHASTEPKAQGARQAVAAMMISQMRFIRDRSNTWFVRDTRWHGVFSMKAGGNAGSRERRHLPSVAAVPCSDRRRRRLDRERRTSYDYGDPLIVHTNDSVKGVNHTSNTRPDGDKSL